MSPTSYQTAPPRVAFGGAIIVVPSACVKVPVNSSAHLPIPVPCARVLAWFGLGRGSDEAASGIAGGSRGGAGGGGGGAGLWRAIFRPRHRLLHHHRGGSVPD